MKFYKNELNKIILIVFSLVLISCGQEERFECGGEGLIKKGKDLSFSYKNYERCKTVGTKLLYSETDCSNGWKTSLEMDEVTDKIIVNNLIGNSETIIQCKKIN